jgi:hypothetical protein
MMRLTSANRRFSSDNMKLVTPTHEVAPLISTRGARSKLLVAPR